MYFRYVFGLLERTQLASWIISARSCKSLRDRFRRHYYGYYIAVTQI